MNKAQIKILYFFGSEKNLILTLGNQTILSKLYRNYDEKMQSIYRKKE